MIRGHSCFHLLKIHPPPLMHHGVFYAEPAEVSGAAFKASILDRRGFVVDLTLHLSDSPPAKASLL